MQLQNRLSAFFTRQWQLLLYLAFTLFLRFWNLPNSQYFIYDQGRDAAALDKIMHGHFVLVGPTTGLGGLFLGPLWFYINLPVFILSSGNPYWMAAWGIAMSCFALPLYWILAHKLFPKKIWAVVCALLLAVIPGSIQASVFVWNLVMSMPLMSGALLSFWKARTSRKWLAIGFLLVALTMQSEMAYGVFFLPVLFCAIPWIRKKIDWRDFAVAIVMAGITFIPQGLFELRNHFIMSQSLLHSMADKSLSVSWQQQFAQRPQQLIDTTTEITLGSGQVGSYLVPILGILLVIGFIAAWRQKEFLWKLTALFAIAPYPFFLLWRGNHGYFFSYYITCHFIFLVPLVILGAKKLIDMLASVKIPRVVSIVALSILLANVLFISFLHWRNVVWQPENNAGLAKMNAAVAKIFEWQAQDHIPTATVRVYTANVYTEQYDHLFKWYAQTHHLNPPRTTRDGTEKTWYLLLESEEHAQKIFLDPWYQTATQSGQLTRKEQIGVLTLETWQKK